VWVGRAYRAKTIRPPGRRDALQADEKQGRGSKRRGTTGDPQEITRLDQGWERIREGLGKDERRGNLRRAHMVILLVIILYSIYSNLPLGLPIGLS